MKMSDWYKKMFEGDLGKYWLNLSDKRKEVTALQVSFLKDVLKKGLTLDHCCGVCRVSIPLSNEMPIVGLDLSTYLLREAKKRAKQAGVENLYLLRADMRHLPFRLGAFDNVINLGTSLGFFSEEENEMAFMEIVRV
jgi:ubiquinone/menaquinone biosynthesis C-methylase UbiE